MADAALGNQIQSFFGTYKYKKLLKSKNYLPSIRLYTAGIECEGFAIEQNAAFPNVGTDYYGMETILLRDIEDIKAYKFDDTECIRIAYKSRGLSAGRKYYCVLGIRNSEVAAAQVLAQIERVNRRDAVEQR